MLDEWIEAERKVMLSQSYTVDGQTVTRANLSDIRNAIKHWEKQVSMIKRKQKGKGKARISHVIPGN